VARVQIMAPFDGWCSALEEVPDAAFAGKMLGDGLAIDPTSNTLLAPCGGEIITLPATGHAVSIRTAQGLDVLVHIGLDTVALKGRGFSARVKPGDQVSVGDELIAFDFDVVARGAKSLVTPIVVMPEESRISLRCDAGPIVAGQLLFEVEHAAGDLPQHTGSAQSFSTHTLNIPLRQGLHARPAALLAQRAKTFDATVTLTAHGRSANARSVVSIMALGVRHGDALVILASGADAEAAIAAIRGAIDEANASEGASHHEAPQIAPSPLPAHAAIRAVTRAGDLNGIAAVGGLVVGRATRLERREIEVVETGSGLKQEQEALLLALNDVRRRLQRLAAAGENTRRAIIQAHLEFLDDPALNDAANAVIATGKSAGFAWRSAIRGSIAALQALTDARLRERVDDLLDVEAHVLLALAGEARPMNLPLPEQAILVAEDLLPSELSALDRRRLIGICLGGGGATSHVAILAAAMEIPMLVGVGASIREIPDNATVILDADRGLLHYQPTGEEIDSARAASQARAAKMAALRSAAQTPCRSADGVRVELFANVGNIADAGMAVANGAEGCGLLRTEFLFIDRQTAPGEDEQLAAYQGIADALGDRPLILRLMDVGGDKPLQYLPLPFEENPALGLRGIRTALKRPDLLRTQIRAALRVTPRGKLRLLIPMVTDASEIRAVREIVEATAREFSFSGAIEIGAMIETPAAALTAASLLREVDFLSVGSNDLTQYTLAMDRGHAELARRTDALHPAVLKLVAAAASSAAAAGKLVAVCGGVAADRLAAPILLGLGVRELSVVPSAVPDLKELIRNVRMTDCRELATRCLELDSPRDVREFVENSLRAWGVA
jgi:multiphosphoryl transfer protein